MRRDSWFTLVALVWFGMVLGGIVTRVAEAEASRAFLSVPAPYQVLENPRAVYLVVPRISDDRKDNDIMILVAERYQDAGIEAAVHMCRQYDYGTALCGSPVLIYHVVGDLR